MAKPTDAAVLERARRFGSDACWTITLQRRRLKTAEPEDSQYIFRYWTDIQFLIIALHRLRRAAKLAARVPQVASSMNSAIAEFDRRLPSLLKFRNVGEHFDEYAADDPKRHRKEVDRRQLEVGHWNGAEFTWLGGSLNIDDAMDAANELFSAMKSPSMESGA